MPAETIEVGQRSSFLASAARLKRRASHRIARHLPLPPALMRNREPLVSFTFDDVPVSAHAVGAPTIEAHGARATFYIATGLLGRRSDFWTVAGRDEVADLHRRGHEVGLHSHLHCAASALNADAVAIDLRRNLDTLRGIHPGIDARNFAYPFGQCTLARKYQFNALVRSSRSIYAGVNRRVLDLHYLRATELCDARLTPERLDLYLNQTRRSRGWLIFCLHDVSDYPSVLGCSRRLLESALDAVTRRGMRLVTVDAALDLVAGAATPAVLQNLSFSREFGHG